MGPVFTGRKHFYASTYAYVHAYVDNEIQALEGIHIKWWFSRQKGFSVAYSYSPQIMIFISWPEAGI